MENKFTLEYWIEDNWYVGKLVEVPGIFSQGKSLKELEENIIDAYKLMVGEEPKVSHPKSRTKNIIVNVV